MNCISQMDASCLTFHLDGRLTFRDSIAFEAVIAQISECGLPWVRIDLTNLDYLDSYGIGMIALAQGAASLAGARLELVNARDAVAEVLEQISFEFITLTAEEGGLRISPLHCVGRQARVALAGNFVVKDQGCFLPVIQSVISGDFSHLTIDMGQLRFIDSIGVSLIMTAADEARKVGKELVLGNPQGAVRELLRLTAIDTVIRVS
ncbi:STAS domain-containing protein [Magnetospirillum sulfuroxidans]|uniref:STAS domain-containing protein n=1 Tax=Magnetospirillum sulfuroxidans TaxID=611300 RepID=A0ABS5IA23_9PROT|nr:STAS domain-containing protein [Magnetospirillum sulfuroxidans]MBR9971007.1 STAS domain-containing protein [Magnetospirillum sulfuroxidans]